MICTKFENRLINFALPFVFVFMTFFSCTDDRMQEGKYKRPDWLAGKLYTQILQQPDLSTFAKCLELTGYDSIIDNSGSYTVFAPSNSAFESWFAKNTNYNSIENIPVPELTRLVKTHIVQNPWTKDQLRSLDVFGWIDTLDVNNDKPRGYKRETLLKEPNRKYGWIQLRDGSTPIVDTLNTTHHRRVITDSRKYIPIFYQEYFDIYDLVSSDYEFYFNRPFEGGSELYFANGKIIGDEIFAENGFIYQIDQVVESLRNAYQIVDGGSGAANYSQFFDLVNGFSKFEYNKFQTFNQPGAREGLAVDSLFYLTFPTLTFNVTNEKTQSPPGTYGLPPNVTKRYHHGLMAPTNNAFESLINNYIKIPNGWGSLAGAPKHIKRIIANTHLSINPVYPSDFEKGFYNGESDIVKIEQSNIIQKEYGSNSAFIGLNEAIVPRAFSSVTGAVYLRQGFSKIMTAIENADLLPLLKRENNNYMFFVESDVNTSIDSSLIYDPIKNQFSVFEIMPEGSGFTKYTLTTSDLRTLLLNHVAVENPKGIARKEFIPNIAGNYIIIDNQTGEVSGTMATTQGYNGSSPSPQFPTVLSEADNGKTYEINDWFSFGSPTLYSRISNQFPAFHALLKKAGLAVDAESRYTFISNSEFYTVFVPSLAAMENAGLNSLPVEELRKVLRFHFVRGKLIFTDGKLSPDYFGTMRIDEKSTQYTTIYTQLYIKPGVDIIQFNDKLGAVYSIINESGVTNLLTGINLNTGREVFPVTVNNGVVHEIDKVLIFEKLNTK